tara:strand:+ start:4293 stop:4964 length:672 start_codon:yes stop_codon:yes gene_type:complete
MPKTYFRQIPDLDYINRTDDGRNISDYTKVKNIFKKGSLRKDIFQDTTFFEKYQIRGDDRPDNVANDFYGSSNLDWIVLSSNNILNVQSEWPMTQQSLDEYLLDKYETYEKLNGVHHYESVEIKNSDGVVIFPAGKEVDEDQSVSFFDFNSNSQTVVSNITKPITNLQFETKLNEDKRNIFLLKGIYLGVVFDDLEEMMTYKEGSTQFVSESLKRADNIRLYQ